jgi:enediyne biosynthesis protein E4
MGAARYRSRLWLLVDLLVILLLSGGIGAFIVYRWSNDSSNGQGKTPRELTLKEQLDALPDETKQYLVRDSKGEPLTDIYRDITTQSGVDFTFHNGEEAQHYAIIESLGGGVGLIDYDGDGLLDIFIPGGGYYDGPEKHDIKGHGCRLYKNLGNGKFRDVTKEVGLDKPLFYTHGCAVGDYNRDGWPDLLVTGWGRMALYRNEPDSKGGRRFVEVTKEAGLPDGLWTTSAAWADLDGDGYPDLYVCQYVNWSWKNNPKCSGYTQKIPQDVCPPKTFTGLPHKLFHNNGNGTFTDVSKEAGLRPFTGDPLKDGENGKGLGVIIADLDGDGKPDIYVANDTVDNFLYMNQSKPGHLRFEEIGLPMGVARDDRGVPNGSMGTDIADYDGSGNGSIWCTNYENEMHALYRNQGRGLFLFSTPASGIAAIGQLYVGFGTSFLDLDNHGWEDLVVANGHVIRFPQGAGLRQRPVLLRNKGNTRFCEISLQGGSYFRSEHVGRGLAIGDLFNRGRCDLVISHLNEPVAILRNEADSGQHWIGVELAGKDHRDVVGARVIAEVGDRKLTRFAKGGGSYLSSSDRRLLFGLDKEERVKRITVIWPNQKEQTEQHWDGKQLKADRYWRLVEGKEQPQSPRYAGGDASGEL